MSYYCLCLILIFNNNLLSLFSSLCLFLTDAYSVLVWKCRTNNIFSWTSGFSLLSFYFVLTQTAVEPTIARILNALIRILADGYNSLDNLRLKMRNLFPVQSLISRYMFHSKAKLKCHTFCVSHSPASVAQCHVTITHSKV